MEEKKVQESRHDLALSWLIYKHFLGHDEFQIPEMH